MPERIRKSWSNRDWFDHLTSEMSRKWIHIGETIDRDSYCLECSTSMFVVYTQLMFVVYMLDVKVEYDEL